MGGRGAPAAPLMENANHHTEEDEQQQRDNFERANSGSIRERAATVDHKNVVVGRP